MNAGQQQRILQGIVQSSMNLAALGQQLAGGNGGIPTVPSLYLDFLPPELRGAPRQYFSYGVVFLTIAAGATGTETFVVQSDSDFLCANIVGEETDPADEGITRPTSPLTILITDSGSGRNLQNQALPYSGIVGTGQLPAYMPNPYFVDRSSEVTITVANNDPADAVRIRLAFIGFKLFDMMRGGR